ncbi:MAG: glycosyltransferase family A protein [Leptolyngbyaceae cyanobacterium bins.59]|nr:glycosyltransferase family A protein [Leptolyngbyaceae cyanobacterium bins.59]
MSVQIPTVSIVIPAYNVGSLLRETIASVQQQTFPHWELVVIDDGSTDNTRSVATQCAQTDPRIRVFTQPNQGVSIARNRGVEESQASIIAFLDADDRWRAAKLQTHLKEFQADPELGVSFDRVEFLTPTGQGTGRYSAFRTQLQAADFLYNNPSTTTSTWVLRRSVWEEIGGFLPDLNYAEDLEWLLRVCCKSAWRVQEIPAILTEYRTSPGGLSADLYRMEAGWQHLVRQARSYAPELIAHHYPLAQASHLRYLARRATRMGLPGRIGLDFMTRALRSDWQLILREPHQTVLTLLSIYWHLVRSQIPQSHKVNPNA